MDKCFEWYTSECSPDGYPAEIVEAGFILFNGIRHEILPGQFSHNGWGKIGSEFYLGTEVKPIPAYLFIRYISFVERKVYSGEVYFDKEELLLLFQRQLVSPLKNNQNINYNRLLIGTAPLGFVSVWLLGDTNSKEILQFHCQEDQEFDINNYVVGYKDLNEYCKRSLSEKSPELFRVHNTQTTTIIPSRWSDLYRKEFSFILEFHLLGEIESFQVWFFNGESEYHFPANKRENYTFHHMPSIFIVNWKMDNEEPITSVFEIVEDSIFAIHKNIKPSHQPVKMIVQLRESDQSIKLLLKYKDLSVDVKRRK